MRETGELIGSGGLVFIETKGMYELGYNIMKKYWGLGIATEASEKIIKYNIAVGITKDDLSVKNIC